MTHTSTPSTGTRWRHHTDTNPAHDVTVLATCEWDSAPCGDAGMFVVTGCHGSYPHAFPLDYFVREFEEVEGDG